MSTTAETILAHLKTVDAERAKRAAVSGLNGRVNAVKAYQQRRFADQLQMSSDEVNLLEEINADEGVSHGRVVQCIDKARAAGITKFAIATAPGGSR